MGCTSTKQIGDAGAPGVHKIPKPDPYADFDYTGADEYKQAPGHGANELPPMFHEGEFESSQQIAWIIDDAVARTKPLPKHKKTVGAPDVPLDLSTDEVS